MARLYDVSEPTVSRIIAQHRPAALDVRRLRGTGGMSTVNPKLRFCLHLGPSIAIGPGKTDVLAAVAANRQAITAVAWLSIIAAGPSGDILSKAATASTRT